MNRQNDAELSALPSRIHMEHSKSQTFRMPYMHTHVEYEILFVISGRVIVESNINSMEITAPALVLHKPYMLHRACSDGQVIYERYVVNFGKDFLERFSPWIPDFSRLQRGSMTIVRPDEEMLSYLSHAMVELWESYLSSDEAVSQLCLALILNRLSSGAKEDSIETTEQEHDYIAKVMDYISRHFGECLQTDELARNFFVSRGKLTSGFKEYTGLTVKQYVRLTRINIAKEMLISGRSISEIAQSCGFCDDSHFIRTFRTLVGATPKEYLASKGKSDNLDFANGGKKSG